MTQNTGAIPNLIARTWRGATALHHREAYLDFLRQSGFRAYRATPGNQGVIALSRAVGSRAEFLLISLWESREAIRSFAGKDIDRAVFYPRDDEFLIERDQTVNHYDVIFLDGIKP